MRADLCLKMISLATGRAQSMGAKKESGKPVRRHCNKPGRRIKRKEKEIRKKGTEGETVGGGALKEKAEKGGEIRKNKMGEGKKNSPVQTLNHSLVCQHDTLSASNSLLQYLLFHFWGSQLLSWLSLDSSEGIFC